MKRFGSRELLDHVIHKDLCIGCGACQELCPYFRSYRGKTAMLFPCTKTEGRCFTYCPKVEVDLDALSRAFYGAPYEAGPLGHYLSISLSRAGERAGKAAFQSGGTVTALMQFALEKKMITGAVLTAGDGIEAIPRLVTTPDEVRQCASSKYAAAPSLAALNRAIKNGSSRLGVVSTPCQALAVAKMHAYSRAEDVLEDPVALVIGLFCTWSLDFRSFDAFLADRLDVKHIKKIDIPPPPAEIMDVFTDDGKVTFALQDIRALIPEACSGCIDMTSEFSDVSVGVVEGRTDMNTLIVRTPRGRELVEKAKQAGWLVVEDIPAENLEHLQWAAGNKKRRALAKGKEKGLVNTTDGEGLAYLRLDEAILEAIMGKTTEDAICLT